MWAMQRPVLNLIAPPFKGGWERAAINLDMVLESPFRLFIDFAVLVHNSTLCSLPQQSPSIWLVHSCCPFMNEEDSFSFFLWVSTANLTSPKTTEAANDSASYSHGASNKLPQLSYFAAFYDLWRWANAVDGRVASLRNTAKTAVLALHQPGEP